MGGELAVFPVFLARLPAAQLHEQVRLEQVRLEQVTEAQLVAGLGLGPM